MPGTNHLTRFLQMRDSLRQFCSKEISPGSGLNLYGRIRCVMRKLENKRSSGCQSFLQNIMQINHRATLEAHVDLRSFHAREFLKDFQ